MSRRVMPIDVQEFEVMVERKMPLGIQTFSEITKSEYVYVDKTGIMHKLANSAKFIFLSRPRRFGKSLMLTTLKAYFQGKKELFKGLEAYDLENAKGDKAWQEHVVFHFDFNAGNYKSNGIQELHTHIRSTLGSIEKKWGILVNPADTYSGRFQNAIKVAAEKSGKKVVILIDEYDKPLLQRVESGLDESTTLRDELRGFYGVLKSSDQYIRFAMLTGVTKFSKLSVFSDLNQLYDISLDTPYATICGITQEELEANFAPEIQKLADNNELTYDETLHKLRDEYDGYDFTGKGIKVYNPFSTVNVLNISEFRDYWFQSGTPTFLIDEMQRVKFDILNFENGIQRTEQAIADYKSGENDAVPLLFQAGYLTIKSMNKRGTEFILGYPNKEVERGFLYSLSSYFFKNSTPDIVNSNRLIDDLYDGNLESFFKRLTVFYASVPHQLSNKTERDFQTIFYIIFRTIGMDPTVNVDIRVEEATSHGSSDAVVELPDKIYVFEFKLKGNGTANDALQQINDKDYALKYDTGTSKELYKIGVVFDNDRRVVDEYVVE